MSGSARLYGFWCVPACWPFEQTTFHNKRKQMAFRPYESSCGSLNVADLCKCASILYIGTLYLLQMRVYLLQSSYICIVVRFLIRCAYIEIELKGLKWLKDYILSRQIFAMLIKISK